MSALQTSLVSWHSTGCWSPVVNFDPIEVNYEQRTHLFHLQLQVSLFYLYRVGDFCLAAYPKGANVLQITWIDDHRCPKRTAYNTYACP